jgi:heme oxygenase
MIAERLRSSSQSEHKSAESRQFITKLMSGELSVEYYVGYLANLAWLYETLEEKTTKEIPAFGSEPIWDSRLNRFTSIDRDLQALGAERWRTDYTPTSAISRYVRHINGITGRADLRLIAHHYTRYLGDLSGGQAIAALVARHYGIKAEHLSFYRFEEIDNLVRYKETYRAALDALKLEEQQIQELEAEVKIAFDFNSELFDELLP